MNSLLSIPILAALTTGGDGSLLRSAKLPRSSVNNSMDSTNSHAVFIGETLKRNSATRTLSPDFKNLGNSKLGVRKLLALGLSLFCYFISVVIALSAEKQVFGVNASRVVTVVEDVQPVRDFSMMYLPGQSMSVKQIPFTVDASLKSAVAAVIATRMKLTQPRPAFIGFLDVIPKAFVKRFEWSGQPLCFGPMFAHAVIVPHYTTASQNKVIFAALVGGGDGGSLVNALIAVVVIGLIAWLLWWLLDFAGVPQPFNKVGKVLIALIAVVLLIRLIVRVTGVSL